jgi:hypothetical protein
VLVPLYSSRWRRGRPRRGTRNRVHFPAQCRRAPARSQAANQKQHPEQAGARYLVASSPRSRSPLLPSPSSFNLASPLRSRRELSASPRGAVNQSALQTEARHSRRAHRENLGGKLQIRRFRHQLHIFARRQGPPVRFTSLLQNRQQPYPSCRCRPGQAMHRAQSAWRDMCARRRRSSGARARPHSAARPTSASGTGSPTPARDAAVLAPCWCRGSHLPPVTCLLARTSQPTKRISISSALRSKVAVRTMDDGMRAGAALKPCRDVRTPTARGSAHAAAQTVRGTMPHAVRPNMGPRLPRAANTLAITHGHSLPFRTVCARARARGARRRHRSTGRA